MIEIDVRCLIHDEKLFAKVITLCDNVTMQIQPCEKCLIDASKE